MRSRHCWHWCRFATGVLLALLVSGLSAPAVRASCGDYVVLGGSSAGAMSAAKHPAPAQPNTPCRGPNCSRGPLVPPLAPVVPSTVPSQEWACTFGGLFPTGAATFAYLSEEPSTAPIFYGDGVFHPPR
jgi:hypothetical protein